MGGGFGAGAGDGAGGLRRRGAGLWRPDPQSGGRHRHELQRLSRGRYGSQGSGANGSPVNALERGAYPRIETAFELANLPGDPFDYEKVNVQVTMSKPDGAQSTYPASSMAAPPGACALPRHPRPVFRCLRETEPRDRARGEAGEERLERLAVSRCPASCASSAATTPASSWITAFTIFRSAITRHGGPTSSPRSRSCSPRCTTRARTGPASG